MHTETFLLRRAKKERKTKATSPNQPIVPPWRTEISVRSRWSVDSEESPWQKGRITRGRWWKRRQIWKCRGSWPTALAADLSGQKGLSVTIRDEKWAKEKEMGAFMAVSQGSMEPLRLVEIAYTGRPGSKAVDLAVVGKGVTFDT